MLDPLRKNGGSLRQTQSSGPHLCILFHMFSWHTILPTLTASDWNCRFTCLFCHMTWELYNHVTDSRLVSHLTPQQSANKCLNEKKNQTAILKPLPQLALERNQLKGIDAHHALLPNLISSTRKTCLYFQPLGHLGICSGCSSSH